MKKKILLFIALYTVSILCGCNNSTTENSASTSTISAAETTTSQSDEQNDTVSEEVVAQSLSDLAEAVAAAAENVQIDNQNQTETQTQGGVYLYSPIFPDDFECTRMWLNGSYIYYRYENEYLAELKENGNATDNDTVENSLSLRWAFNADGNAALQYDIEYWEDEGYTVSEITDMQGYYYADFDTYQKIFWCEDGYSFQLQIPSSVGAVDTATNEYSGEDVFDLKKTFYPLDDTAAAE